MKKTIIIGSGGHALSLLGIVKEKNKIIGYCDIHKNDDFPLEYLGTDEEMLKNYPPEKYAVHCAIVYEKEYNLNLRKGILQKYANYDKSSVLADSAIISDLTQIDCGCEIFERCVVKAKFIGCNSIINTGAIVEHGVTIGNNTFIGPGAVICGGVEIGDNVFIGAGVAVRDDVTICDDAVIGIGSNVVNDITEAGVYAGNPARKIR